MVRTILAGVYSYQLMKLPLFGLIFLLGAGLLASDTPELLGDPIQFRIDISHDFGEWRDGRFHAGLDYRTGGRAGRRILAPVDGWIWRLRTSWTGYGKVIYVKGDDDHIYVFAHLVNFTPALNDEVTRIQLDRKRYSVDISFPPDSLRVERGEVIGFSGESGAGGPHLHFERRTPDNHPINPRRHGIRVVDTIPPSLPRLILRATADDHLWPNGERQLEVPVRRVDDTLYRLDTTLYVDRPFGLIVETFDRMRPKGMRQTVYQLDLLLDGDLFYRSRFDTLPYDLARSALWEYDYPRAVDGDRRFRRLWRASGNVALGSRATTSAEGVIGADNQLAFGHHTARVVATDPNGNRSALEIPFVWGPPAPLFAVDSIVRGETTTRFFLDPTWYLAELGIEQLRLERVTGTLWQPDDWAEIEHFSSEAIVIAARGGGIARRTYRLAGKSSHGPTIVDAPFTVPLDFGQKEILIDYRVDRDGLVVEAATNAVQYLRARCRLLSKGNVVAERDALAFIDHTRYRFFFPADPSLPLIDRIEVTMSPDTLDMPVAARDSLQLAVIGGDRAVELVAPDGRFRAAFPAGIMASPRWVELRQERDASRAVLGVDSDRYILIPNAFETMATFAIDYTYADTNEFTPLSGLTWWDPKDEELVWINTSEYDSGIVSARSRGGGQFATAIDLDPPIIRWRNVVDGRTVSSRRPTIDVFVDDELSGLGGEEDLTVRINGVWMIPDYDIDAKVVSVRAWDDLPEGRNVLTVEVRDRAGNLARDSITFVVPTGK